VVPVSVNLAGVMASQGPELVVKVASPARAC
jgi:hypothetical protein